MTSQNQNENLKSLIDATDNEIFDYMKASKTIKEWNERRESVKDIKGSNWVGLHIDSKGLIGKTTINNGK